MTEIYKFVNGLSPPIMSEIFTVIKFTEITEIFTEITNCKSTVKYGIDSIVYKDPHTKHRIIKYIQMQYKETPGYNL